MFTFDSHCYLLHILVEIINKWQGYVGREQIFQVSIVDSKWDTDFFF